MPGAASTPALSPDGARAFRGFGSINMQQPIIERTYHSLQVGINRRMANGFAFGFTDTIGLYDRQTTGLRLQHNADGTISVRADQKEADELLGNNHPQTHIMRANFVYLIPGVGSGVVSHLTRDWSISGIWSGATPQAYIITPQYVSNGDSVNLTGSPDYAARIRVVGDPGSGCSDDPHRQFNTAAFAGPQVNSVGLESGTWLPEGVLYQPDGSGDRADRPARRQPLAAVPARRLQCVQPGRDYQSEHDDADAQSVAADDDSEPAVRRGRQPDRHAVAAAWCGLRGRDSVSGSADDAVAVADLVLNREW